MVGYSSSTKKKHVIDRYNRLDGFQEIMLCGGKASEVTYYNGPLIRHSQRGNITGWRADEWLAGIMDRGGRGNGYNHEGAACGGLVVTGQFFILTVAVATLIYTCHQVAQKFAHVYAHE